MVNLLVAVRTFSGLGGWLDLAGAGQGDNAVVQIKHHLVTMVTACHLGVQLNGPEGALAKSR